MIANLGYSHTSCINAPLSIGSLTMSCTYGTIGQIFDYGVTSPESDGPLDACLTNDYNKACRPDSKDAEDLFAQAVGQERYNVRFGEGDLFNSPGMGCAGPTNFLFVQFSCVQSNEDQQTKYGNLALATGTICLISLLFVVALQYLFKNGKIQ